MRVTFRGIFRVVVVASVIVATFFIWEMSYKDGAYPHHFSSFIAGNSTKSLGDSPVLLKTILYWDTFFGDKDFEFGHGQQPFLDAKCPETRCFASSNR